MFKQIGYAFLGAASLVGTGMLAFRMGGDLTEAQMTEAADVAATAAAQSRAREELKLRYQSGEISELSASFLKGCEGYAHSVTAKWRDPAWPQPYTVSACLSPDKITKHLPVSTAR
jgi:hypothetical protein